MIVKRVITNFFFLISGEMVAKFLYFLAIVFTARHLSVEDFGKLGFAEAFFSYFIYIGIAGVDTIATRDVARNKGLRNTYLANLLSLKLVLSLMAYCLLASLIIMAKVSPELKRMTLLYGLCLFPMAISTEWFFQAIEDMKYVGVFRGSREILYLVGIVSVLSFIPDVYYVPVIRITSMLVATSLLVAIVVKMGFKPHLEAKVELWKTLLKQSYPILISQVLVVAIFNFSIVLLGLLRREEEIGFFTAVQKITLFFIGLVGVYWVIMFPLLSRLYVESREQLRTFEETVSRVICAFVVPVGVFGFVLAESVVFFLYGSGYAKSAVMLEILVWAAVFNMLNVGFVYGLLATNNQSLHLRAVLLQAILMGVLATILVPKFGGLGASIAWLLVEVCGFFLCKKFYNRFVTFRFYRFLIKPILASLVIAFSLRYFDGANILFVLPMCLVGYVGIMLVIKGIEISELRSVYTSLVTK
jgi:O-antigen/teichoic acid export membrane protein